MTNSTRVETFREQFNDTIEGIQRYAIMARSRELQEAALLDCEQLIHECEAALKQAVQDECESDANAYLSFSCMAKALLEELRLYIALKLDDPDSAWTHLINAQSAATDAMKAHDVASHLDPYTERLLALEELLFPSIYYFSPGFIVHEAQCSICGSEYGECEHIKCRPYMGQICARVVTRSELLEVSVVTDPASKHCRALEYTDDGVTRNWLSLRAVPAQPDNVTP